MMHFCKFDTADHLKGKNRSYESVKAAVLAAGRFSVFEAQSDPGYFNMLHRDPTLEIVHLGYPWIGVKQLEGKGETR